MLRQNSPGSSCHFFKHKFVPPQIYYHSSVLWNKTPNIIYFCQKQHIKVHKFSDLLLLALKFTRFLISFLELRVSFSSNFASLFSGTRQLICIFHFKLYIFWTKGAHQSANFQTFRRLTWKSTKFLLSFYKPRVSFPIIFTLSFSVMT